jgi:hypothetical protein
MDDFLEEIKEDLREEKVKQIWHQHGKKIVIALLGALSIILLSVMVRNVQEKTHLEAATKFLQAQKTLEEGKKEEALSQFKEIAEEGDVTYRTLARLTLANLPEILEEEKAKIYKNVYEDLKVSDSLRDFARLMGIIVQIRSQGNIPVSTEDLKPLLQPDHPMMPLALELLTMICIKNRDYKGAQEELKKIINMPQVSSSVHSRAQTILNQLTSQEQESSFNEEKKE